MKDIFTIIILVIFLLILIYLNIRVIIRLINYLRNNLTDIIEFLDKHNQKFMEFRSPRKDEWNFNPFESRNSWIIELGLPFSIYKHKVFIAIDRKGKLHKYWIRTISPFFGKYKIDIKRDYSKLAEQELRKKQTQMNKKVIDKCPACNYKVKPTDKECPDCALFLN
jgi:hypothetical protein